MPDEFKYEVRPDFVSAGSKLALTRPKVCDRVNYGIGYGETKSEAEELAMENCPNCKVIVSDCQLGKDEDSRRRPGASLSEPPPRALLSALLDAH